MSALLDAAAVLDPQRARDLAANDAAEAARIKADLDYLANQQAREQRRLQETAELERSYFSRVGWGLA